MSKKVIVVSSSFRKNGNSETAANMFAKGAEDAGNSVDFVALRDIDLGFCKGCLYCQSHDGCVIDDGVRGLLDKVSDSDVIVFATPIYYYSVCGRLKTFMDRLNPLFVRKNRFSEVYLIAACADDNKSAGDGAIKDVQGWVDCFEGVVFKEKLLCTGVTGVGEVTDEMLERVYEKGKNV